MIETITTIAVHPATWLIFGVIVKAFAPAFIPLIGSSRKLVKELVSLHERNEKPNAEIRDHAIDLGLEVAAKYIEKKLIK